MSTDDNSVPKQELEALERHRDWAKKQDARRRVRAAIYEAVARYKLTLEQGEVLCQRRGVGPLNPRPDPAQFDVWSETHWPVEWVVAWIIFRDEEYVRHCWPAYMASYNVWQDHTVLHNGKPTRRRMLVPKDKLNLAVMGNHPVSAAGGPVFRRPC